MRECLSCAFCSTLYMSRGGVLRLIISMTPPVKSCKASLMRPNPMASYDPQILQQQVERKIAFSKNAKESVSSCVENPSGFEVVFPFNITQVDNLP